jgi:hypothetical protein
MQLPVERVVYLFGLWYQNDFDFAAMECQISDPGYLPVYIDIDPRYRIFINEISPQL